MPDWLGGAIIFLLGAFLTVTIVGIVVLILAVLLSQYRWARCTLSVLVGLIAGLITAAIVSGGDPAHGDEGLICGGLMLAGLTGLCIYIGEVFLPQRAARKAAKRASKALALQS